MANVTIRQAVDASRLPSVDSLGVAQVADTDSVFPQSIASGGPTPTGVVVWTRISPDRYDPPTALRLEVAADESFDEVVLRSELPQPSVKASDNYTVRVDLTGSLEPDSVYFYRFAYGGVRSRTGRCRTLPAPGDDPSSVRFGLLNCQNYQNGYFGAMAHLAAADVDFVLHLGDYVYETVADGYPKGPAGPYKDRRMTLPSRASQPMSLDDFRTVYETYKRDPYLQRLHERHTVIQTWDDHAIANDRYWDYDADAPVFPNHPCGDEPEFTRHLTRAGIQAWWEFVPARIGYDRDADHLHGSFTLYRSLRFGDLVSVVLTDERLFRSEPLSLRAKLAGERSDDPSRTMLGTRQREWFLHELESDETRWTVWANAVLFETFAFGRPWMRPATDSWDGYEVERATILRALEAKARRGTTNFVTLTGDMHTTLASRIRSDDSAARPVGVEFMTPGVTSVNFVERVGDWLGSRTRGGRVASRVFPAYLERAMRRITHRANEDFELFDSAHWGYSIAEFTPDDCTWDVYWVDKTVNAAEAESVPAYRVRVPARKSPSGERPRAASNPCRPTASVDGRAPDRGEADDRPVAATREDGAG